MFEMRLSGTGDLTFIFTAVTFLIDLLLAGWTLALVTLFLAHMQFTVKQFLTGRVTFDGLFNAALHGFGGLTTATFPFYLGLTRWTWAGMT